MRGEKKVMMKGWEGKVVEGNGMEERGREWSGGEPYGTKVIKMH